MSTRAVYDGPRRTPRGEAAAVIGVGLAGEYHLRALTALGFPAAGVLASRSTTTADAAARWRTRAYDDLDEFLTDDRATTVHVCTSPTTHSRQVRAIIAGGCRVICEKPLAPTSAEARALADLVAGGEPIAWVTFNRRFDEGVQVLREAVADGELGEPISVWGSYRQQSNAEPSSLDRCFDPDVIGPTRVVSEIGSHWLDLAGHVLGSSLRRVSARITRTRADHASSSRRRRAGPRR